MIVDISREEVVVTNLYQYDYGQKMEFAGEVVPDGVQVHFFQNEHECRTEVKNGAASIPDYLLMSAKTILAFLYIADIDKGKTIKKLTLLVLPRERPPDYVDPTRPADYSRLLPIGGKEGQIIGIIGGQPVWLDLNDKYATDDELMHVAQTVPQFASMREIEDMLNKED